MARDHRGTADPAEEAWLVGLRRDLHRRPELRFAEHETAQRIRHELASLGLAATPVAETGTVCVIGAGPGATRARASRTGVIVRADIDAYPVQDAKDPATCDYASRSPGVTHACGHDVHITAALGLARRLAAAPPAEGSVTLVFQPAEEIPYGEPSGAAAILDSGILDGDYAAVLGLHCWPSLPAGTVGVDPDVAMAAKVSFRIVVAGAAAHVATPSAGRDAILALSAVVAGLHAALAREVDASDLVAFNVGTISGGRSQSSLAASAEATGTLRTRDPGVGARVADALRRFAGHTAEAYGCRAQVEWANQMPEVRNDPALVDLALRLNGSMDSVDAVVRLDEAAMATDDFALYGTLAPSLYAKLGVRGPQAGSAALHAADFDVDERCLTAAVDLLHGMVRAVLRGETAPSNRDEPASR